MPLYSTIASQNPTTMEAFHDVSQTFWVEFWVIFLGNSKSYQKTFMKSKNQFQKEINIMEYRNSNLIQKL